MRPSRFLLFTALLFATAAQAAPSDEPRAKGEVPVVATYQPPPESRLPELGGNVEWGSRVGTAQNPPSGARFGTGYETRQDLGARGVRGRGR